MYVDGKPLEVIVAGSAGSGKTALSLLIHDVLEYYGFDVSIEDQDGLAALEKYNDRMKLDRVLKAMASKKKVEISQIHTRRQAQTK